MKKLPLAIALIALVAAADPAFAHHVMGGRTPATLREGLLSGLAHPIIGLDHFAAVVAIGCLAAAHHAGALLVVGYVITMMVGVDLHLMGTTVPAAELLVALTVLGLGAVLVWRREISLPVALTLFALVGLIHGYALGESIYGAERTPLVAYLAGLAVIQSAVAFAATLVVRAALRRADVVMPRLIGAGIIGVGLVALIQQIVPAPPGG